MGRLRMRRGAVVDVLPVSVVLYNLDAERELVAVVALLTESVD